MMQLNLRPAVPADIPVLNDLIQASATELSRGDYSPAQIAVALGTAWAVDTQLFHDGTYFVVETENQIIASGGWSRRKTLFGGDAQPGREAILLDPKHDPARIRAFFVHPAWARRGIGRMLLNHSESEARAGGFQSAELIATLPGQRLYAACGYQSLEAILHPLSERLEIRFIRMVKRSL